MRLSIVEIDYHPEVLRNLCRIFQEHMDAHPGLKLQVFATDAVAQKAGGAARFPEFDWFSPETGESIPRFMQRHEDTIRGSSAIFFNTLASHFRFFARWKAPAPMVLRLHNASAYLNPDAHWEPIWTPFFLWKDFSHFMRKELGEREAYWRRRFVERVDAFQFPDSGIASYVEESGWLEGRKSIPPLPFAQALDGYRKELPGADAAVQATVVGGIDPRRRDYGGLLEALKNAVPKLQRPLKLCLLGRPRGAFGQRILADYRALEDERFSVDAFEGFVPQEQFEVRIAETDFLFIPALENTRYTIWRESYGKTKISGNVYDMIRYGKPALLPEHYRLPKGVDRMVERYTDAASLAQKTLEWVNGSGLSEAHGHMDAALAGFRREAVGQSIRAFLDQVKTLS
jgi:hypothetical protein